MKKTKIIATIGPASESPEMLESLILAGIDSARLNFSHGSHEEQGKRIKNIRKIEKKLGRHIAIIADIQGPKIRVGNLPEKGIELKNGQEITIDTGTREFYEDKIPLPSPLFRDGTKEGHIIFFDDGTLQAKITGKKGGIFKAIILKGGILYSKKGVNAPSLEIESSVLNSKDRSDIEFASKAGADYIALSFLRNAKDIKAARVFLKKIKSKIGIISKIERPEALSNINEIIVQSDAIMIARGDLGIETPLWELPIRQKEIIDVVRSNMKPVIVATQMLDSMIRNPIPTRAEVSDVANAVFDSADCVMLSGETANGKYPAEAVEMMKKILLATERSSIDNIMPKIADSLLEIVSVAKSAVEMAAELNAKAIITGAVSGESAKTIAYFRPEAKTIVVAASENIARRLALVWGVEALVLKKKVKNVKELLKPAIDKLKEKNILNKKDKIISKYRNAVSIEEVA